MAAPATARAHPDWDRLYETAASQAGYFALGQALEAGYSAPLLQHHIARGRVERVARGIFRLVHFPAGDNEDLVIAWLWSGRVGVFSHETALFLHQLSDALPAIKHLTVPESWARRRLKVPAGVRLYFADVPKADRSWKGPFPVTSPLRTLRDCARDGVSPEVIADAKADALRRGLVAAAHLRRALP